MVHPFHLAFPVDDLAAARHFYVERLGCTLGRTDARWIDIDFFGHQLTAHLVDQRPAAAPTNGVDGDAVPVRHFGLVLPWEPWWSLRRRLEAADVSFRIAPHIRFEGEVGEQATLFVDDPAGNALEFKSFRDPSRLFAS